MQPIDNIELTFLTLEDYPDLVNTMQKAYTTMPNSYWKEKHIKRLIDKFPKGQVAIKVNNKLVGCALSIVVDLDKFPYQHTYREITQNYTFDSHSDKGNVLYGIDVFIDPAYQGLRLGRRLYDYRKTLCEQENLKGIAFGGRIPNYHKYMDTMTPKTYIDKVKSKEINDPVLNFQISNDFHPSKILKNYLEGDKASNEVAVLLEWDNIYYQKESKEVSVSKRLVRLGLVQWQMRRYKNFEDLMETVEFFIDAVSGYRSDFVVFPEFFNAPLMAESNHLSNAASIRQLATYTQQIIDRFTEFAISYNINIISGSMPEMVGDKLYNIGYLCRRDGTIDRYEKIHITPDEKKSWGLQGGSEIKTFDTDCGKIGVLICYDSEFPELGRLLADQGMNILFVPFLTDTQNGYSRVRYCSQARAIENECYVAITGSVGNLPKVHNMDIQFAQSMVFTPCDFTFPTDGIKAQTTPNTEMILIADVDIDLLRELNQFGSVRNLQDRRKDLFDIIKH